MGLGCSGWREPLKVDVWRVQAAGLMQAGALPDVCVTQ